MALGFGPDLNRTTTIQHHINKHTKHANKSANKFATDQTTAKPKDHLHMGYT
jgi:hypothetical protein